jgi:hypothetical protein
MRVTVLVALVLALVSWAVPASAEDQPDMENPSGGAQYYVYFGKDWELQISVYVWGHVVKPGMYSIPRSTDLMGAISLAGGPAKHADLNKVQVIRTNPTSDVITVDVDDYMRTARAGMVPLLKPGDTIYVPGNKSHFVSRVLTGLAQVAMVANAYYVFFVND